MPVGLFDDADHIVHMLDLPPGSALFMFSDGTLELIEGATLELKERLLMDLCSSADLARAREVLHLDRVVNPPDDITVFLLQRGG